MNEMASKPHNKRLWVEVSGDIYLKFSSGAKFGERSNEVGFQIGFRVDRHEKHQKISTVFLQRTKQDSL